MVCEVFCVLGRFSITLVAYMCDCVPRHHVSQGGSLAVYYYAIIIHIYVGGEGWESVGGSRVRRWSDRAVGGMALLVGGDCGGLVVVVVLLGFARMSPSLEGLWLLR